LHTTINIRLTPRASRNELLGGDEEGYRVRVSAPPVEGLANKALVVLLSEKLGIAKGDIEITSGKRSRHKTVRIHGLTAEDVARTLKA
jgi:uncharacterized protein